MVRRRPRRPTRTPELRALLVVEQWAEHLAADGVALCSPVRLEILYSARTAVEYDAHDAELDGLVPVDCGSDAFERALDVQRQLAHKAAMHHRSVGLADLLIAAAAELADVTVWHYDEDFDRVAEITGQPAEWIVPRGTIGVDR